MATNKVKLSIIVPVYNVEDYLEQCLASLIHQPVEKEIIIINDGSTDRSGIIAAGYAAQYSFIYLVNQENRGLSAARNLGLQMARGEYICFIDSDDWVGKNVFSFFNLQTSDPDIIMGNTLFYYDEKKIVNKFPLPENLKNKTLNGKEAFVALMQSGSFAPMACNYFYRRGFLDKIDLQFQHVTYEDELWTLQAVCQAETIRISNLDFYYYRQRMDSIVNTVSGKKRIGAMCKVAREILSFAGSYSFHSEPELKSWVYVKVYELYGFAFPLLPTAKTSAFKLPIHSFYRLCKQFKLLTPVPRRICNNYYKTGRFYLKHFLKDRVSEWFALDNSTSFQTLILLYNFEEGADYPFCKDDLPPGCALVTDHSRFPEARVVIFYWPNLANVLDEDLDKPDHQVWVLWMEDIDQRIEDEELNSLFDYKMSYNPAIGIEFKKTGSADLSLLKKERMTFNSLFCYLTGITQES